MTTLAEPPVTPPPPYRTPPALRRLLAALAALVALAMVAGATVGLLDLAARQTTTVRASFDGVRALEVAGDGGRADHRRARRLPGARGHARHRGPAQPGAARRARRQGTLRLSSSCPAFFTSQCAVRYEVSVPPDVRVRADSSAGDVVAEDLVTDQAVALETSAGDVSATGVNAPSVRLHSSAGDVVGRGLGSERVDASSSAGDVRVSLLVPPLALDADSSAGDVELVVPDEVYRLDADTTAGDVDTREVRVDRDSRRSIRARSSAGDVRIDVRR